MNLRKLLTFTGAATLAVMPVATAQNPTILQGSYVSNVFGQSNFVKNPNAQTNTANVTLTTATATRSTTTPLVATSEYNVTITSANGTAAWATRTFDAGMKNQNCEARFTYRGFQATSKAQIKQGANVVAELVLTPSATDPRIASINFPCGDLSSATTFVITDTATLAGTNEIGGIYVGLATNQANVAQAEFVGSLTWPATSAISQVINQTSFTPFPALGTTPTAAGNVTASGTAPKVTITNMKAGSYQIVFAGNTFCFSGLVDITCSYRITDGTTAFGHEIGQRSIGYVTGGSIQGQTQTSLVFSFDYSGPVTSKTFQIEAKISTTNGESRIETASVYGNYKISVYRFPSSSELVVTPETQNVFGAASWPVANTGSNYTFTTTSTTAQTVTNAGFASSSATYYGAASASTTSNAFGMKVSNIPPGTYRISAQVSVHNQSAGFDCSAELHDDGGRIGAIASSIMNNSWANGQKNIVTIYRVTSFQSSREFLIKLRSDNAATTCMVNSGNGGVFNPSIVFEPLDQPSNSALYVQGPVKAAGTGTAIPSGYVGEVLYADDGGNVNTVSGAYNLLSLALTPGVWDVQGKCTFNRNGATITDANWIGSITNQNGNPADSMLTWFSGADFINVEAIAAPTEITRVYWNGTTNITTGSISNTSSNLVYIRCYPSTFTGGPVTVWRKIWARRVN